MSAFSAIVGAFFAFGLGVGFLLSLLTMPKEFTTQHWSGELKVFFSDGPTAAYINGEWHPIGKYEGPGMRFVLPNGKSIRLGHDGSTIITNFAIDDEDMEELTK